MKERYYEELLKSAIKGAVLSQNSGDLYKKSLLELKEISTMEKSSLLKVAEQLGIRTHYFKRSNLLPRVQKVLGFLKASCPNSLLDIGSGRGAFIFPFMDEFPLVPVTSIDILEKRVDFLKNIALGKENFNVLKGDICTLDMPDERFDIVTMLEVLEHIPSVEKAIANGVRLAKRWVVVSVPSERDDNPEHIHLLTREKLTEYFNNCGINHLTFDSVAGHLIMIGRK